MKRTISSAVVLATLVFTLASCGSTSTDKTTTKQDSVCIFPKIDTLKKVKVDSVKVKVDTTSKKK
ncbi:MAG TPA: hypothetical protein VNX68_13210 [Nitrosopumilaceae archaeon]|nr:hypothetical protein [Nitrosopumilaceae archaeon]